MNRRTILKLLSIFMAVGITRRRPRQRLRFYVAGARFRGPVRNVERVLLRPERFRGETAIAVHLPSGEQIGWVPRTLVAPVAATRAAEARVIALAPDGVPWRWYRVEVI